MKRIAILGCGWLGLPLGAALVKTGFSVNGSTTSQHKIKTIQSLGMSPFLIELGINNDHEKAFFDVDILVLTIPPSNTSEPKDYFLQLEHVLNQIGQSTIKHVIFISSTSVYPSLNREVLENDASEEAKTRSGISLVQAEKMFYSVNNTIVRFAGLVGGERHPGRWFAGKHHLKGGNIPVNMIHQDDCIGIIQTIISNNHWGEVFNGCSSEHPKKSTYYPELATKLGLQAPQFMDEDKSEWKIVSNEYLLKKTKYQFMRSIYEI